MPAPRLSGSRPLPPRGAPPHMPLDLSCPARAPPFRSPNSERPTERDRESDGASAGRPIGRPRRRGADDPHGAAAPTRRAPVGRRWHLLALSRPPAGLAPRHKAPRDSAHMTSEHVHGDDDGGEAMPDALSSLSFPIYIFLPLSVPVSPPGLRTRHSSHIPVGNPPPRASPQSYATSLRLSPPPNTRAHQIHTAPCGRCL